jgi:hypothetical protein
LKKCWDVDLTGLAQNSYRWQAVVNAMMNYGANVSGIL